MTEPKWLVLGAIQAVHQTQLDKHGGAAGVRDEGALESALNRPQNHFHYGEESLFVLAASYASGIIKNHPFVDGNKRTNFLAAFIFLYLNGYHLQATEADAVHMTLALAASEIDDAAFSQWLEDNSKNVE